MDWIMIFQKDSFGTTNYSRERCKCQMQIAVFVGSGSHFTMQSTASTTVLIQGRTLQLIESFRFWQQLFKKSALKYNWQKTQTHFFDIVW